MIENFLEEHSMEKLERLRKSKIIKIGKRFELNMQKMMRKDELVRKITEHMVDENVFEETILEELLRETATMTPEQVELEKARIQMESERNRMELEKARIEQETRSREIDLARSGHGGSHDGFKVAKQARLVPKFEEANIDEYFVHFERPALNLG